MKRVRNVFATAASLLALASVSSAQSALGATDITAKEVQEFVKQLPPGVVTDRPIRVVDVGGYRVGVFGVFRPKGIPGVAVFHETKVTEIYYLLDGGGTLVTGGSLREPVTRQKSATNGWMNNDSAGVNGGVSRHVSKGDIVIIPPGVAHWWSALDGDVTYLMFRPDPQNELALK
jgi:mannose-6-phosphate isomerase-like protein (cupin superfamily)